MNSKRICHLIGAGEIFDNDFKIISNRKEDDYLIACDGGLVHLFNHGITPDMIVGDFDSCDYKIREHFKNINTIELPVEKDYTDMHTAILHGLNLGFSNFNLFGATGGRIDHTIANIQILSSLSSNNSNGVLYGKDFIMHTISNSSISFDDIHKGTFSVFSLSDTSYGVSESGAKYSIENITLTNTFPLGVSNEFIGKKCTISVENGTLLIIVPRI